MLPVICLVIVAVGFVIVIACGADWGEITAIVLGLVFAAAAPPGALAIMSLLEGMEEPATIAVFFLLFYFFSLMFVIGLGVPKHIRSPRLGEPRAQ